MASLIGALRVTLGLDTAAFDAGAAKAEDRAYRMGEKIGGSIRKAATTAGKLTGVFAALGTAGLTVAAKGALDYADAIVDLADRTGATTKIIQEFRYAAQLSGSDVATADAAMEKFTKTLGLAQQGSKAQADLFKMLGVTSTDFETAFMQTLDGLERLPTVQQRNAVALQLFGKSAGSLTMLLGQGSREFDNFAQKAKDLGIVLDEDVLRNAGKVNDELDTLKMIINAQFAGVIADNADSIYSLASALATLTGNLLKFWQQDPRQAMEIAGALTGAAAGGVLAGPIGALVGGGLGFAGGAYIGSKMEAANKNRPKGAAGGRGRGGVLPPAEADVAKASRERARAASDALRREKQFASDLTRAQAEELRAKADLTADSWERRAIEQQMINADRVAARDEIDRNDDYSAAQKERLKLLVDSVADLRSQKLDQEEAAEIAKNALDRRVAANDNDTDMLQAQSDLARTMGERRDLELRLLDKQFETERLMQEAIIASEDRNATDKQIARERLKALDMLQGAARTSVMRDTAGPLAAYFDAMPRSAAEISEAYEGLAADGLGAVVDGFADASVGARKFGDVVEQVASDVQRSLLKMAIQKGVQSLFGRALGTLFGGSGGAASAESFLGAALGGGGDVDGLDAFELSGARAKGGSVLGGRSYVVGELGPEIFTPSSSGNVIANDDIDGARGGIVIHQTFAPNLAGSAVDRAELGRFAVMVKQDTIATFRDLKARGKA
ncbi:hypothetical protein [Sphingomonas montanisoli]|uniref:Bacteriophage tail tape measure N-terminal domain-containing protein n=1 Tax=Sphingomonas montanisoli TaxID=2606412 RepID=A0A5D9C498_9SPHN|nr:hypothetical protein [Sphingomonas montanisoli]TZG26509.1 hypothetical protein FYJ91_16440 [Sphingomonas montanisoli]